MVNARGIPEPIMAQAKELARRHLPPSLVRPAAELYHLVSTDAERKAMAALLFGARSPVDLWARVQLLERVCAISLGIDCTQRQSESLAFIRDVLELDSAIPGCIVEAGCYKGGSTAKFSLVAARTGRRMVVFDSFEGIPVNEEKHGRNIFGDEASFEAGKYRGALEEVKANVGRYGVLEACQFVKGWFEDTLPAFDAPVAAVFLDVDLASSTRTCLRYLYSRLSPGGVLYSHDGHLPLVLDVFADDEFWAHDVGCPRPQIEGLGSRKLLRIVKS